MAFNRNFPHQKVFKRYSLREIHSLIVEKESQGWDMVKPIYKEVIQKKQFNYDDTKKVKWKFTGDEQIVRWVAVMTRKESVVG